MPAVWLLLLMMTGARTHAEKAVELQQSGHFAGAIAEYRAALQQNGPQPGLLTNLGAALAHEGDYTQAMECYQKALRADSRFEEARLNLGLAYYKLLRWADAAREFATYHQAHPDDVRSALLLADSSLELDQYQVAIAALVPFERQSPENLGIAYVLGTAYIRNGQESLGSPLIDRIMQRGEVPEVHMMMGDSYRLVHEYKKSIEEYRRALQMNPSLPLAHLRIGETTLAMGDLNGALGDFEAEYAVNPLNFDLNFYLGYVQKQRGSPERAKPYFERAAAMRPDTYQPNFQLALLAKDRGDYDEARRRLEEAVKTYPNEREAHVILAQVYYRLGLKPAGKHQQEIVAQLTALQQANESPSVQASVTVPQP